MCYTLELGANKESDRQYASDNLRSMSGIPLRLGQNEEPIWALGEGQPKQPVPVSNLKIDVDVQQVPFARSLGSLLCSEESHG